MQLKIVAKYKQHRCMDLAQLCYAGDGSGVQDLGMMRIMNINKNFDNCVIITD